MRVGWPVSPLLRLSWPLPVRYRQVLSVSGRRIRTCVQRLSWANYQEIRPMLRPVAGFGNRLVLIWTFFTP
nr:MAG TPA: hypothetical protein [Caudoviricetes sp.]